MKKRIAIGVTIGLSSILLSFFMCFFFKIQDINKADTTQSSFCDARTGVALCILLKENASFSEIEERISVLGTVETRPYLEKEVLYIVLEGNHTTKELTKLVKSTQKNRYVDKAFLDFFVVK